MTGLRMCIWQRDRQKIMPDGFVLPTILVLSVILLAIGVSLMQLSSAIARALVDQHWNRLAKVSAQAGVSYTASCLQTVSTWSTPLSPSKNCDGTSASPVRSNYIAANMSLGSDTTSTWSSTFTASVPAAGSDGIVRSQIVGKVELATAGGIVVKTYTHTYNAVVASAAASSQGATQISTTNSGSDSSSCEVAADQLVYCSGDNGKGNFGTGNTTPSTIPVLFGSSGTSPTSGKTFTQVSVGTGYTCAVTTDQKIYCAGENALGQLGNDVVSAAPKTTPVQFGPTIAKRFIQVSTGITHTCGVTTDLWIYCAGNNSNGQIGHNGALSNFPTPQRFNASPRKSFMQVSVGNKHTCALTTQQQVFCAGLNSNGQLGSGNTTQSLVAVKFAQTGVASTLTFLQVSSGLNATCALATDKFIYCAGSNVSYGMGDGGALTPDRLVPVRSFNTGSVVVGKKFNQVAMSGASHVCAVGEDNLAYCAGNNSRYQLGDGSIVTRQHPVLFGAAGSPTVSQVSAGSLYTCAVGVDQAVYCSGDNDDAQQGIGNTTVRTKPEVSMMIP